MDPSAFTPVGSARVDQAGQAALLIAANPALCCAQRHRSLASDALQRHVLFEVRPQLGEAFECALLFRLGEFSQRDGIAGSGRLARFCRKAGILLRLANHNPLNKKSPQQAAGY
jgi:hypothetical protein